MTILCINGGKEFCHVVEERCDEKVERLRRWVWREYGSLVRRLVESGWDRLRWPSSGHYRRWFLPRMLAARFCGDPMTAAMLLMPCDEVGERTEVVEEESGAYGVYVDGMRTGAVIVKACEDECCYGEVWIES